MNCSAVVLNLGLIGLKCRLDRVEGEIGGRLRRVPGRVCRRSFDVPRVPLKAHPTSCQNVRSILRNALLTEPTFLKDVSVHAAWHMYRSSLRPARRISRMGGRHRSEFFVFCTLYRHVGSLQDDFGLVPGPSLCFACLVERLVGGFGLIQWSVLCWGYGTGESLDSQT